jgi:hypothetical protein
MQDLNKKICECHNPKLVDRTKAPNENIIYHLYSDGTITYQKGGDAYGMRTMFDLRGRIIGRLPLFTFPLKSDDDTYAILTEKECLSFREEMEKFKL